MNIDSRFHAVFVENTNGVAPDASSYDGITADKLPLILVHQGGKLGFSRTYAASGNAGEGDTQDSTLGAWLSLSQRDWSGGRGTTLAQTVGNSYAWGTLDTRYSGRATLPARVFGPYALPSPPAGSVTFRPWIQNNTMYALCGSNAYQAALSYDVVVNGEANINATWALINTNANYATARTLFKMNKQLSTSNTTGGGFQAFWCLATDAGVYFADDGAFTFGSAVGGAKYGFSAGNNSHVAVSGNTATPYTYQIDSAAATPRPWNYLQQNYYPSSADVFYCRFGGNATNAIMALVYKGGSYVFANDGIYSLNGYSNLGGSSTRVIDADVSGISMPTTLSWTVSPLDGKLYFGAGQDLIAFDGSTISKSTISYDKNLPSDISTMISGVAASPEGVFVVTGEANKRSAIFQVMNGAWHCVYVAANLTQIYSIWVDNRQWSGGATTQPRLWWFEGTQAYYIQIGPNESNWANYINASGTWFNVYRKYQLTGEMIQARWGSKYAQVRKHIGGVIVGHEVWDTSKPDAIQVDLQVDSSGVWIPLQRERHDSVQHEYRTQAGTWARKTVIAGGTLTVDLDNVTGLSAGVFVRIERDVLQIKSIVGNTVTFVRAASKPILAGAIATSARAQGFEFAVRVRLSSDTITLTPVVNRVSVRFAYEAIRRARYTLHVLVENAAKDNLNFDYPHQTTDEIDAVLKRWMLRESFWLIAPDGERALVKCINAAEAQYSELTNAKGLVQPQRIITLSLIEIEDGL